MSAEMTPPAPPNLDKIKAGMRATWMAGDFGVIARTIAEDAERFAASLHVKPGSRVLDVATGTGNVALPLARGAATAGEPVFVTGVDIAPNLLEQARERAAAAELTIAFDEGDAEALPYADGSFDLVVTMFGAMFAPRPDRVAAEFVRVLRPGGLLAMANWTPGGFSGQMFAVGSKHAPPPPGIPPPVLWGDPATVHRRLDGAFRDIQTERIAISFDMPSNASDTVEHFRRYFGPTQMAFNRLDDAGQRALREDLIALWSGANIATDPEHQMLVPNEYLRVTAIRN